MIGLEWMTLYFQRDLEKLSPAFPICEKRPFYEASCFTARAVDVCLRVRVFSRGLWSSQPSPDLQPCVKINWGSVLTLTMAEQIC